MSGKGAVTWRDLMEACKAKGISVEQGKGGEMKLLGPGVDGQKRLMRIGHKCCKSNNAVVYIDYVKKAKRTFGFTDADLGL